MKARSRTSKRLVTVQGILLPQDWDQDGRVIALGLSGTDEREYQIDFGDKKSELLALLQNEVEICGLLRERDGKSVIVLSDYRLIKKT